MSTDHQSRVPSDDVAFHVEQRGIDFIPAADRWATPRNIGAMWAGSAINVEYFIYGALLMGFGFTFKTALLLIVLGNLSFFLLGIASLQGQETGTTAFTISRAAFGTRGSRLMSFFNWITQLGFETEGLILIVGAAVVFLHLAGVHSVSNTGQVLLVIVAAAVQAVMPYFGHATMVKVLRALIIPFAVIFGVLAIYAFKHGHLGYSGNIEYVHGWPIFMAGLAFTIALSGLGWTECGNDYTRYLPREAKPLSVVGWIFLGTAVPEIVVMGLGAYVFTFLSNGLVGAGGAWGGAWGGANPFLAFEGQHLIPSWFVAIFMVFAIVQLFGINSLDLYSSGVSLQAMGLTMKRYQAVILDSVIAGGLSIWAILGSTFSLYMKEFVGVIIVWIAPWFAIFVVDWLLRKRRYDAAELQRTDSGGLYFGRGGFNYNAIAAFVLGLIASTTAFSKAPPPVNFPFHWMTPLANHWGASFCNAKAYSGCNSPGWFGGADFSVFFGIGVAAVVYLALELATGYVKEQTAKQTTLEPQR